MATFVPNLPAIAAQLRDVTEQPAERIAEKARRRYQMHELHTADPRTGVIVETQVVGHRVTTRFPFAAIDEFGGPEVHSRPSAAMRSAAMEEGRFVPAPKP